MPAMKRPSRKAEKIAFAILGTPANLADKPKRSDKKKDEIITYQETQLMR